MAKVRCQSKIGRRRAVWGFRLCVLMLLPLMLTGCLRNSSELQREHIGAAVRMGMLSIDDNMTVQTTTGSLEFGWGDELTPHESGTFLIGHRSFVTRPDTIFLRDVISITYDADIVVSTTSGVRYDWSAGDWRLLYEDGHPAALVRDGRPTRIPLDTITHMHIDGGLTAISIIGWALLGLAVYVFILISSGDFFRM